MGVTYLESSEVYRLKFEQRLMAEEEHKDCLRYS